MNNKRITQFFLNQVGESPAFSLTAEKKVVRFVKGRLKEDWEIKDKEHKRNEPLDLRNYATAALAISRPVLKKPDADGTPVQPVKKARGRRQLSGGI